MQVHDGLKTAALIFDLDLAQKLFIELQVQYMKIASSEHSQNMLCT